MPEKNSQPSSPQTTNAEMRKPAPTDRIHVTIRNRTKIVADMEVTAVTSFNETGRFDILPAHANFICIIKQEIILHLPDGKQQTIPVQNGVLKVKNGNVNCYIDLLALTPNQPKHAEER